LARILAELAAAVRIRDEFIAMAGHELKTPLDKNHDGTVAP